MVNQRTHIAFASLGILYMFLNNLFLPEGLLWTTLLTPLLFIWLMNTKGAIVYFGFLLVTLLFALVQYQGIDYLWDYTKSFLLLQAVAIFTLCAHYRLREHENPGNIFKLLAVVNLILVALAILLLFIPAAKPLMWYLVPISKGIPVIPRLKLFTYEASYYSFIIMPVFAYFLFSFLLLKTRPGILLLSSGLALILSFSMGVLGGIFISVLLVYIFNLNELKNTINWSYFGTGLLFTCIVLLILFRWYPDNILFERISNIWTGQDTSAKGRLYDSFIIAWKVAGEKSLLFGTGPGQFKHLGRNDIMEYYQYAAMPAAVRIPNAVAETLNIFGIAGLAIRFSLLIFLFIRTRVQDNYYRLFLFLFLFLYQFTGSFILNVVEYIGWALAFSPRLFTEFNRVHFLKPGRRS
jgi:hypothetical protein